MINFFASSNPFRIKGRNQAFDTLKGILILCVFLGNFMHTIPPSNQLLAYLYLFHIPLFVFISGYFSRRFDLKSIALLTIIYLLYGLVFNPENPDCTIGGLLHNPPSCMGLNDDGTSQEFSWRNMYSRQSSAVTFSGDQTSGYNGGSEYFDIDIDEVRKQYPKMQYVVFNNNVFSGITFSKCICRAGYMMRDKVDSGKVFEPKTVQTSYMINCDSTLAHLFALDIINRKIIWLNQSVNSMARVGAEAPFKYLTKFFNITKIINVYDIFKMKATEIVTDPCQADIVVSDDTKLILDEEKQIQITSRDQEKIMKYMENL